MKHRRWELRAATLIGSVFSLVLFIFLFVYLQGTVVRAAVPDSPGGAADLSNRRKVAEVEKMENQLDTVFLPVILKDYPSNKYFLEFEELVISTLEMNTSDKWTMDLFAGDTISLRVAPGAMVDIVLSVIDENGTSVVDEQNLSPAGEVESIVDLSIQETGQYAVVISTKQGEKSDYGLMLLDQDSYNLVLRGTFFNDGSQSDSVPEETDHFWFFSALSGDRVSFTVTPDMDGDPYVELYDPAAERILTLDDGLTGEPESLENYILPESGLYSILVGEFDFLEMDYQITLSK